MTITPGDECLYGARIERDKKKERFTVKAALLQPNRTEGS